MPRDIGDSSVETICEYLVHLSKLPTTNNSESPEAESFSANLPSSYALRPKVPPRN